MNGPLAEDYAAAGLKQEPVSRWRRLADRLTRATDYPWIRRPILALAGAVWIGLAISPVGHLAIRDDESYCCERVFWVWSTWIREPRRGDLVEFRMTPELAARVQPPRDRPYARVGRLWSKRVIGLPGDQVAQRPSPDGGVIIAINGQEVARTLTRDRYGQEIRAAALSSPIPPGRYYVQLEHPRSFDSRYFGYLPSEEIRGVVVPLW
jgi:conjugal transfer pilin signal peptidase TrbI